VLARLLWLLARRPGPCSLTAATPATKEAIEQIVAAPAEELAQVLRPLPCSSPGWRGPARKKPE